MNEQLWEKFNQLPPNKQRHIQEEIELFAEEESARKRRALVRENRHNYRNDADFQQALKAAHAVEPFALPEGGARCRSDEETAGNEEERQRIRSLFQAADEAQQARVDAEARIEMLVGKGKDLDAALPALQEALKKAEYAWKLALGGQEAHEATAEDVTAAEAGIDAAQRAIDLNRAAGEGVEDLLAQARNDYGILPIRQENALRAAWRAVAAELDPAVAEAARLIRRHYVAELNAAVIPFKAEVYLARIMELGDVVNIAGELEAEYADERFSPGRRCSPPETPREALPARAGQGPGAPGTYFPGAGCRAPLSLLREGGPMRLFSRSTEVEIEDVHVGRTRFRVRVNVLDRLIGYFSPELLRSRLQARAELQAGPPDRGSFNAASFTQAIAPPKEYITRRRALGVYDDGGQREPWAILDFLNMNNG